MVAVCITAAVLAVPLFVALLYCRRFYKNWKTVERHLETVRNERDHAERRVAKAQQALRCT